MSEEAEIYILREEFEALRTELNHAVYLQDKVCAERDRAEEDNQRLRDALKLAVEQRNELRQANRWIPVTERLPELPNWVLAYTPKLNQGQPFPAYYQRDTDGRGYSWWNDVQEKMPRHHYPTHWRPLPAPPEVEG